MIFSVTEMQAQALAAEKARRKREQRIGHDLRADEHTATAAALTGAHEAAQAATEHAGATKYREGPGRPVQPGHPRPGQYERGYIDQGHAADSPQHDEPNATPLPAAQPGRVSPLVLPGVPAPDGQVSMPRPAAYVIPRAVTGAFSMGSPSDR